MLGYETGDLTGKNFARTTCPVDMKAEILPHGDR